MRAKRNDAKIATIREDSLRVEIIIDHRSTFILEYENSDRNFEMLAIKLQMILLERNEIDG